MDKKKQKVKEYDKDEFERCDVKVIVLGDSAVGKSKYIFHIYSRLVERFLLNDYEERT